MYQSLEIKRFRGLESVPLTNLKRVNLVAGMNGVGKSALLEALFLHCGAFNPELTLVINGLRGVQTLKVEFGVGEETPWDSIFKDFDPRQVVEINGKWNNEERALKLSNVRDPAEISGLRRSVRELYESASTAPTGMSAKILKLDLGTGKKGEKFFLILDQTGKRTEPAPPPPPFRAFYQPARVRTNFHEDVERFGALQRTGKEELLIDSLRVVEPRVKALTVIVEGSQSMLHADIGMSGRRFVPLAYLGEGLQRISSIMLLVGTAERGVVMIDEIENGLHYSILENVWAVIANAAELFDVQLFLTTHSFECIKAAHTSFSNRASYDLGVIRLDRVADSVKSVTYDKETLEAALVSGLEIR